MRGGVACVGLGLPLAPLGLTRHFNWIAPLLAALLITGLAARRWAPRAYRLAVVVYTLVAVVLFVRSFEIVDSEATDVWLRVGGSSAALVLLYIAARRIAPRLSWVASQPGSIAFDLMMIVMTIAVFQAAQYRLWTNTFFLPALLITSAALHFKPRCIVLAVFVFCSTSAVFGFYGFIITSYPGHLLSTPPPGVAVDLLAHGSPEQNPGARIYTRGRCPSTQNSVYLGSRLDTVRLDPNGNEVVFVGRHEPHSEAVCTLTELCAAGEVVSGSEEGRYIRFSRLDDGALIKDIPVPGMPTFMVLSPDERYLYATMLRPGVIVRIDLERKVIDREFTRFMDVDPSFSGINNIVQIGDRIVGAFSSYYTLDDREGAVFSVDLDLDDFQPLFTFHGSWAFVTPGPDPDREVFFKVFSRPGLWRVPVDGRPAELFADIPSGYHFMERVHEPSMVVITHWSTGELMGICTTAPGKHFTVHLGGMGRPLTVWDNRVMTPTASGYATLTLDPSLCD
jgi:hypothetical protein